MGRKLVGLTLCLAMSVLPAVAQRAKDATEVDPDGHHLLFENAYVRVIEARMPTGYKVPLHSHPPNRVGVALSSYRVKFSYPDGRTQIVDRRAGESWWSDTAVEHAVEVFVGPLHGLEIELKDARPPAANLKAKDLTEVAPDVARVVLENEQVRVVEIRANSGSKSPLHSHPARVAVSLTSARFKATLPDGTTRLSDSRVGQAVWREPEEHSDEVLVGPAHIILVEIKPAAGSAPPAPDTSANDAEAIRAAEQACVQASAAKDLERVMACFTADAMVLPANAAAVSGTEAIRAYYARRLAGPGFSVRTEIEKVEVARSGEVAYLIGRYESSGTGSDGQPVTDRGKYLDVWKKQPDGSWRHAGYIANSDLPPPGTGK